MTEHTFKEALVNRRMLICLFTGFASGLPFFLIIQLIPGWFRSEGVGLAEIGFFALVGLPYNWKFLWAPLLDRFSLLPLGRRRSWMLVTQLLLLFSIAGMGFLDPKMSLQTVAYLAAAVALFSATLDIALDAFRRELLADWELGLGNSIHIQTYRLAGVIPGGLSFILADYFPWSTVFLLTSVFMLVGILMTLFIDEAIENPMMPRTIREAMVEPFKEFVSRLGARGALFMLLFVFCYKLGDNLAVALQTPFFIDMGFTLTQIGAIVKSVTLTAFLLGSAIAGLVMVKLGINRALWLFGFVQMGTILGFYALSLAGNDPYLLGIVVGLEYLGVALGATAITAYIASETNPTFAATQLALFLAIATLPRTLASAVSGVLVEWLGWPHYFLLCTALAIPGMLLLFKIAPWNKTQPGEAES